jgi:transposase
MGALRPAGAGLDTWRHPHTQSFGRCGVSPQRRGAANGASGLYVHRHTQVLRRRFSRNLTSLAAFAAVAPRRSRRWLST